ncbi:MAG: tagaturonate epimerase family protein [Dictyoglomus sp.]|nr:tagaturonate epimerase family protein [Dictyoglomus sp.]MDW8189296.1 tagaturonate epimerase family protein [Dictyoglomus sp.]
MKEELEKFLKRYNWEFYEDSLRKITDNVSLFIAKTNGEKKIGILKKENNFYLSEPHYPQDLFIDSLDLYINFYPLSFENYLKLKEIINISPSPCDKKTSFGTGDRLGLVSSSHLKALKNYSIFPVISQQSPRELIKTHRDFKDVLLKGVLGVLESGYQGRFGADADHIKDEYYLQEGINAGFSMYTLDISDFLEKIENLKKNELQERFRRISSLSKKIIEKYKGKKLNISSQEYYEFNEERLCESAIIYERGLDFIEKVYINLKEKIKDFDLEVSIDEGERDTTLEDHLFVAEYLHEKGIDFWSLAPKFPGEFQKALDYQGDIKIFSYELKKHYILSQKIEGYRLSLHSGSDKFSIYKILSEITQKNFHIKTSGTSWLQGVKVIAKFDPQLFSELYLIALNNLEESKKAYKVSIKKEDFPKEVQGDPLVFFEKPEVKQLFHISYGVILDEKKKEIYDILDRHEKEHYEFVRENIENHLKILFEEESQ